MSLTTFLFDNICVVLLARGDVAAETDRTFGILTLPARLTFPVLQRCCCVSCLEALNSKREKLELIYLLDCSSNRYLNLTFYNRPTDSGRNNKALVHERACDCLLSLFISLCKHCCVRENMWMLGYIFLSCHGLLQLTAGVTPSQRARRQPELNNDNTFDETTS